MVDGYCRHSIDIYCNYQSIRCVIDWTFELFRQAGRSGPPKEEEASHPCIYRRFPGRLLLQASGPRTKEGEYRKPNS